MKRLGALANEGCARLQQATSQQTSRHAFSEQPRPLDLAIQISSLTFVSQCSSRRECWTIAATAAGANATALQLPFVRRAAAIVIPPRPSFVGASPSPSSLVLGVGCRPPPDSTTLVLVGKVRASTPANQPRSTRQAEESADG